MQKTTTFLGALLPLIAATGAAAIGLLETPPEPAATASGAALVAGWHCNASRIEIQFDERPRLLAAYGTDRPDTEGVCGKRNNGFGLLVNWADLGAGRHTVRAFADGVEFGNREVTVVDLGGIFLTGKAANVTVNDFPSEGRALVLEWREGVQGFVAKELRSAPEISGIWNGANLEKRRNCAAPQNNGDRGTYAQWSVTYDTVGDSLKIVETGITGLSCTYFGLLRFAGNRQEWVDGEYTCTDGKTGAFHSTDILVAGTALSIRLAIKLTGSESCDIDAIIGGSRF